MIELSYCEVLVLIFVCKKCKFIFSRAKEPETCPDCGSESVFEANEDEVKEYEHNKKISEQEEW